MTYARLRLGSYLHHFCEALLYCWAIGLVLPHTNAFYNLGLYATPIVGSLYLVSNRGWDLQFLDRKLMFALIAFLGLSLLSSLWAPSPGRAFTEWRGNQGIAGLMAGLFALTFQSTASQRRFWQFSVLLSAALCAMSIADWFAISRSTQSLIPPYPTMRHWGDRILLCFPFLLFIGESANNRYFRAAAKILSVLCIALMIITGARGIWLALVFSGIAWAAYTHKTRQLGILLAGILLVFGLSLLVPNNPLQARLDKITYTSDRIKYTWGPALTFWTQAPFFGIGHGNSAFFTKAEELADKNPEWLGNLPQEDKEQRLKLGPHSNYLEVLAGTGIFGFIALLYFYGQTIRSVITSRRSGNLLVAATGCGIFVKYMIHGSVESINWKALGFLAGLLLAALAAETHNLKSGKNTLKGEQQ